MVFINNLGFKLQLLMCLGAAIWLQLKENPVYARRDIKVVTHNDVVEKHLRKYEHIIGPDFEGYRNHIYRVMSYSMHFLNYNETFVDVVGSALVFHDIGLWTDKTLAYLEPGAKLARERCFTYSEEELTLQDNIIMNHHKLWPFLGENGAVVEAVRKADWIDASNGMLNKGMPWKHITTVKEALPAAGFYNTLMEIGPRYHGSNFRRIFSQIITIFRW